MKRPDDDDEVENAVLTPPDSAVRREARITFPEDDVATAVEFATALQTLRKEHPRWTVEGVARPIGALLPHRPKLTVDQIASKPKVKKLQSISDFLVNTELNAAVRVNQAAGSSPSSARSSSDGEVQMTSVKEVVLGQAVVVQVPPHSNEAGTISEITSAHCFKVTLHGGGSWWCSVEDVQLGAPSTSVSTAVPLSTLKEVQTLRAQNALLLRALRLAGTHGCTGLSAEDTASVEAMLRSEGEVEGEGGQQRELKGS